jgi:hypothetical protein
MSVKRVLAAVAAVVTVGAVAFVFRAPLAPVLQRLRGEKTVADRLVEFGDAARGRLAADFARVGVVYPPTRIVLVGLKQERRLEVWLVQGPGPRLLKTYPILAASGKAGPKLREYDMQVPEGVYEIESLHPNSAFHVALRVGYPNSFEKAKARIDNRNELGSDIMIHGSRASIGCVAMGDEAAEELFVLAADVGIKNVELVLCPVDFRVRELPQDTPGLPDWAPELYALIKQELAKLKENGS